MNMVCLEENSVAVFFDVIKSFRDFLKLAFYIFQQVVCLPNNVKKLADLLFKTLLHRLLKEIQV